MKYLLLTFCYLLIFINLTYANEQIEKLLDLPVPLPFEFNSQTINEYETIREDRTLNGIMIPKRIWKLIDKYRHNATNKFRGINLPIKYSPEYIVKELKKCVEYDTTEFCEECKVNIPIKIKKNSYDLNYVCLDGYPLYRHFMPPYECPICGLFCGKYIISKDGDYINWWDRHFKKYYYFFDAWERYHYYLSIIEGTSYDDDIELFSKAAWYNKYNKKLFENYITRAIQAINSVLKIMNFDYNEKTCIYYFRKAELLRQIGYFEKSKAIVDELTKKNLLEDYMSSYFYELLEEKNANLAVSPDFYDGNRLKMEIDITEKDEINDKIIKFAKDKNLLNGFSENKGTPLFFAIYKGKTNIAKYLFEQGANPNILNDLNLAPIFQAVISGNLELVRLMANKDNVNLEGECKITPIEFALDESNLEMIKLLVDLGADVNHRNEISHSLLQTACFNDEENNNQIVEYLITLPQINQSKEILQECLNELERGYLEVNGNDEEITKYKGTLEMRIMIKNALQKLENKQEQ